MQLEAAPSKHAKVMGAFTRLDLFAMGFQDDFMLYTDNDVIFNRDIKLSQFPNLPKYLACSSGSLVSKKTIRGAIDLHLS